MSSHNKDNYYLQTELAHLREEEADVEIFLKLSGGMVSIKGVIIAVNADDRNPTVTVRSVHKGLIKKNILMLNHIASINATEMEDK